jgi:death on curing protein
LNYPTIRDIIKINQIHIRTSGGYWVDPFNLKERGTLELVLDEIQHQLFDTDLYPSLAEKAAKLSWTIIAGHIFWDGNKRTGMATLSFFVRLNGYDLDITDDEIVEVACVVAGGNPEKRLSLAEFTEWTSAKLFIQSSK